jgi:hypothetical protein
VPDLVNSVDNLVVRHAKQGIEAERFRADQPLVQVKYTIPTFKEYIYDMTQYDHPWAGP